MSEPPESIEDMENLGIILLALVLGAALGAGAVWVFLRTASSSADATALERTRADEAQARADAERARAEAAAAREELAHAHTEVARADVRVQEARAETALAHQEVAEGRAEVSRALSQVADARAQVAALEAQLGAAHAERDVAVERAREIAADREALVKDFKVLSGEVLDAQGKKADATAEQRFKATEQLMAPIQESLRRFNERLGEVEKARVAMSTELSEQVKAVQFTGEQLRRETNALSTALRKPQVRGAWGELQLKRVAELAGMLEYCDFDQQTTSVTSEDRVIRPDMRVQLSESKFVYVDAKVPLSAFLDAQEADDERDRQAHLQQFAKNVRGHVEQLGGKNYWKAATGTPEFVIMFIPNEALGLEALRLIPDLHEHANGRNVVVATPTTLIAMLRAVAYGWKQAALADSAAEVFTLGRELYDRLSKLGANVDKLGRALGSAVNAYNTTVGTLETRVMVSARRFRDLKVTESELAELTPVEAPVRQVASAELVQDATAVPTTVGREPRGLPEAAALTRGEPDLFQLVDETNTRAVPRRNKGTMAG